MFGFKLEKALPYLLGGAFLFWLIKRKDNRESLDFNVNEAINILDSCFDKIGTFDSNLEPVFEVLQNLTTAQILLLHKDFGTRYYNSLFGWYSLISILEGYAVAKPLNLSGIMYKEFDEEQIERVKLIYSGKMLTFPL